MFLCKVCQKPLIYHFAESIMDDEFFGEYMIEVSTCCGKFDYVLCNDDENNLSLRLRISFQKTNSA